MSVVWTYLKRYRWLCLAAVVLVVLEANCELLLPTLISRIIDEGVAKGDVTRILQLGSQMALIALAGIICVLARNLCSGTSSQKFGADLRRGIFEKILRLSEGAADQMGTGSLVTRVMKDSDQLSKSVNSALRIGVKAPVLCVGSILYALRLDSSLSMTVALVVVLVLGLITAYMRLSERRFVRVRRATDRVNTVVQEFLRGIRLIKALGRETQETEKFRSANRELADAGIRLQVLSAWFAPLITLVVYLGTASVLWLAGVRGTEAGKVSAFVTYMTQMLSALMTLIDVFKLLVRSHTSSQRMEEVLRLPEEEEPEQPEVLPDRPAALAFENVTFAYPNGSGVPALREVSFTLNRGETLAVVGPTGAGKSTLAWLCARFYDPRGGRVLLDSKDLRSLSLDALRRQVSVVPQRSSLFSGTVRENLSMGGPEAKDGALWSALKTARAERFVAELGGLDGTVNQGGSNLSGGQRQRLCLARALVHGGVVLILDDCTSALDAETERQVLSALEECGDRAAVLITQKVQNARRADHILVLEEGRAVGLGDHRTLLKTCPAYREIWAAQIPEEGEYDAAE